MRLLDCNSLHCNHWITCFFVVFSMMCPNFPFTHTSITGWHHSRLGGECFEVQLLVISGLCSIKLPKTNETHQTPMKVIETQYIQIFPSLSNMALQVIQQLHMGSLTLSLQIGTLAYPSCALKLFHTQGQMEAHQVFLGPIRRHLQWCITIAKASHENLQFLWASRSRTTGSSTGGASKKTNRTLAANFG